ncbi:hypothetical protein RJ641_026909 [Dillenia turbinata]|uniref:Uncharacterized protein n=1 Tax=Dillenia turbinata TaxID=194707 RepID=A0AAN8W986_9MAGN
MEMDARNWKAHRSKTVRLGQRYAAVEPMEYQQSMESNMPVWKVWWRKLLREKRRMLEPQVGVAFQVPYDPQSYELNFDQGLMLDEPDSLSRSFSVRFADPSRIFQKNEKRLIVHDDR